MSRRRIVALSLVSLVSLVSLLSLIVVLGPRRRPAATATAPAPASAPRAQSVPRLVTAPGPAAPALLPGGDEGNAGPGQEYIEKYDGRSGRLLQAPPPEERHGPRVIEAGGDPSLVLSVNPPRIEPDGQAVVTAVVPDGRAVVERMEWQAYRASQGPGAWQAMRSQAGGQFLAEYAPPADLLGAPATGTPPPTAVEIAVRATGRREGQAFERVVTALLFVQRSGAALRTGSQRVERRGGDLHLTVDAEVKQPGTYFAQAELWGTVGGERRSIAFARQRLPELAAGKLSIDLLFGGQVIKDSGVEGPYDVRSLELYQVDTIPPHLSPPIAEVARTEPFSPSDFW